LPIFKKQFLKLKALWSVAFIILSIWYLYWICYDVVVWNKTLAQVTMTNYTGLGVSLFLAILGTQINKIVALKSPPLPAKLNEPKVQTSPTQPAQQIKQTTLSPETNQRTMITQKQSPIEQKYSPPQGRYTPTGCNHSLGYLHERPKSEAIPNECVTCVNVVACLSPAKREPAN
jgi:hypothetical protein